MNDNDKQPIIGGNDATVKPVEQLTIGEIRTIDDLPLIVTHSAPVTRVTVEVEKTCRTCKFWLPYNFRQEGECLLHTMPESPITILGEYYDGHAEMVTPAIWSCPGHQPRPDADARE